MKKFWETWSRGRGVARWAPSFARSSYGGQASSPQLWAVWVGVVLLQVGLCLGQVLAPVGGDILIPTISPLRVEKVLYDYASIPQLSGNGHQVYVVQVEAAELAAFISRNVAADKLWMKGSIARNPLYADILDWVMESPEAEATRSGLAAVVDLAELRVTDGLYFKAIYDRGGGGGAFSHATLWIIRPELNQVILLNLSA